MESDLSGIAKRPELRELRAQREVRVLLAVGFKEFVVVWLAELGVEQRERVAEEILEPCRESRLGGVGEGRAEFRFGLLCGSGVVPEHRVDALGLGFAQGLRANGIEGRAARA